MADTQTGGEAGAAAAAALLASGAVAPGVSTQTTTPAVVKPSDGKSSDDMVSRADVEKMAQSIADKIISKNSEKVAAEKAEAEAKAKGEFKTLFEQRDAELTKAKADLEGAASVASKALALAEARMPAPLREKLAGLSAAARLDVIAGLEAAGMLDVAPVKADAAGKQANPAPTTQTTTSEVTRASLESSPGILDARKLNERVRKLREAQKG